MSALPAPSRPARIVPNPRRVASLPTAWRIAAILLPLLLIAAWGAWLVTRSTPAAVGGRIGSQAPGFTLTDLDGAPVRLADLAGRPVIVNFWASWCGPCVREFPLLDAAAKAHASDGLAVLGIVYEDTAAGARAFMTQRGATWPALLDPGSAVASAYGIYGPPETFFIGRDGRVAGRQIGELNDASLARQLATILGQE
jgi:cytochrome c biogenesis protein CcmG/thiol:disulfide interchange protein DsbE